MYFLQAVFDAVYGCHLKKNDNPILISDSTPDVLFMLGSSASYGVVYSLTEPIIQIPALTALDLIKESVLESMKQKDSFTLYALYKKIEVIVTFEKFKGNTTRVLMKNISADNFNSRESVIEIFVSILCAMGEYFHCRRFCCAIEGIDNSLATDDYDDR